MFRNLFTKLGIDANFFCFSCLIFLFLIGGMFTRYVFDTPPLYDYDVVVVGGGISGLTCAHKLNELKVLVIEKEERLGGKIFTESHGQLYYDYGALWAETTGAFPFGYKPAGLMIENGHWALFYNKQLYFGNSVMGLLKQLNLDDETLGQMMLFYSGQLNSIENMSKEAYDLLNGFFQIVHPGEINQYTRARQMDAFMLWNTNHYTKGMGESIEQLAKIIKSEIRLNSEVVSVIDHDGHVEINYIKEGLPEKVIAKSVVVATPAPIARDIIKNKTKCSFEFLHSLNYASFTVVALGVNNGRFPDAVGILTPQLPITGFILQKTEDKNKSIILAFYANNEAKKINESSDKQIIHDVIRYIEKTGIQILNNIVYSGVKRWDYAGPIISSDSYSLWSQECLRPSDRVILAGDYAGERSFPYGIKSAIKSGEYAAKSVKSLLLEE